MTKANPKLSGFTIVELLVVIVIIGILAAITIVAYTGISGRAVTASLQSDLSNASTKLKMYQVDNGRYPDRIDDCPTPSSNNTCFKSSPGNDFGDYSSYNYSSSQTYVLTAKHNTVAYRATSNSPPADVTAACPSNFITVPGSSTYSTSDFCVMKYGAKNVGGIATSQAAGTPWVSISQTNSITTAAAACTGCHLTTEGEYLTIAQNVLTMPSNWSSGTVGTGYIYSGHNDSAPNNALVADTSDSNGYYGETNTGGNQRRTLTLTNGQVIWDLAGNVWEWTSGQTAGGQPGVPGGGWNWREWTAVTNQGTISPNPSSSATGITGASSWNSSNGIGQIYSNTDDTVTRGFLRGGDWGSGGIDGVLSLNLSNPPYNTNPNVGFRVSR